MQDEKYNPNIQTVLDEILLGKVGIKAGKVFGLPCYSVGDKVFATIYGNSVGLHLPLERIEVLKDLPHIGDFRPYGKSRGKNMIAIFRNQPHEFHQDKALLLEAATYALERTIK